MVDPLVNELAKAFSDCRVYGENRRRVRIAVSPEEYQQIRQYMLKTYGEFFASIVGIKLTVEPEPATEAVTVEWR